MDMKGQLKAQLGDAARSIRRRAQALDVPVGSKVSYHSSRLQVRVVTVATIEHGGQVYRGFAICSPDDVYNEGHGNMIALGRALAELDGRAEQRRQRKLEDLIAKLP